MATLVVITYADQRVAEEAKKSVQELEDELTIAADQVASITRDVTGRYHAHISHRAAPASEGIDWGPFWEALFELLFSFSLAFGAGSGALRDRLGENLIDKGFGNQVRKQLKPGMSALFMILEHTRPDKAVGELARYGGTIIKASPSKAELERLWEALAPSAYPEAAKEMSHRNG